MKNRLMARIGDKGLSGGAPLAQCLRFSLSFLFVVTVAYPFLSCAEPFGERVGSASDGRLSTGLQPATGFVEVTASAGLSMEPTPTMGNPIWGDLDGDGFLDLFMSRHFWGYSLYRNNRDGTFTDMQILDFREPNTDLHAGAIGDFNNDGYLDLYMCYGGKGGRNVDDKRDQLYLFLPGRGPVNVLPILGVENRFGRAQSVSLVDFDNDGFLDIFVNNGKLWGSNYPKGRDILYRNLGNDNHWVKIVPRGTVSNAAGIGVKVFLTAGKVIQFRELVSADGGKLRSQGYGPVHFGLGDATSIDSLVIEWPSGIREEYENLDVDQTIIAVEESGLLPPQPEHTQGLSPTWEGAFIRSATSQDMAEQN